MWYSSHVWAGWASSIANGVIEEYRRMCQQGHYARSCKAKERGKKRMKTAFRMMRNTWDFSLFTDFKDSIAFFLYFWAAVDVDDGRGDSEQHYPSYKAWNENLELTPIKFKSSNLKTQRSPAGGCYKPRGTVLGSCTATLSCNLWSTLHNTTRAGGTEQTAELGNRLPCWEWKFNGKEST